jgi:hypothetical protein
LIPSALKIFESEVSHIIAINSSLAPILTGYSLA